MIDAAKYDEGLPWMMAWRVHEFLCATLAQTLLSISARSRSNTQFQTPTPSSIWSEEIRKHDRLRCSASGKIVLAVESR
jgi:hypothetical protein